MIDLSRWLIIGIVGLLCTEGGRAASLSGQVCDITAKGLPDVRVVVQPLSGTEPAMVSTTLKSGYYQIDNIRSGHYFVEASLVGFLRVRYYPVFISNEGPNELNAVLPFDWNSVIINELSISGANVFGVIRTRDHVLADGKVCLTIELDPPACTLTDGAGYYSLTVPPGHYLVTVSCGDDVVYKSEIDLLKSGDYPGLIPSLAISTVEWKTRTPAPCR